MRVHAPIGADLQDIRSLFTTLLTAMPAFGNVGSLIGLIFFMYAYIGVYVFGTLQWNVGAWAGLAPAWAVG